MPIYEYECGDCSFRFEKKQGFDDTPVAVCPECGGKVHRVFSPLPIIFKGSGFYITDSRGGGGTQESTSKAPKEVTEK
ncbi:FmdB family zinc ribbon protein [Chloroflexota bacterium]